MAKDAFQETLARALPLKASILRGTLAVRRKISKRLPPARRLRQKRPSRQQGKREQRRASRRVECYFRVQVVVLQTPKLYSTMGKRKLNDKVTKVSCFRVSRWHSLLLGYALPVRLGCSALTAANQQAAVVLAAPHKSAHRSTEGLPRGFRRPPEICHRCSLFFVLVFFIGAIFRSLGCLKES